MLGPQNNSVIHDNWVFDQGTASSGALYPDEGSAYSTWVGACRGTHDNILSSSERSF